MKINNPSKRLNQMDDLNEIYALLKEDHRSVYFYKAEEDFFFYRTLTRKEYRMLVENEEINEMEKEDIVCEACVLWPENYDFENCNAGIPTTLTKSIMENSFLDSIESRKMIINHYREEMFELDSQINCIINEAFPQFDIEEIEDWDIERTAKYLSRAEWKLSNLRGMNIVMNPFEEEGDDEDNNQSPRNNTEELGVENSSDGVSSAENIKAGKFESIEERQERMNPSASNKEKLTPEKLEELKAKFPEINWEEDSILQGGENALRESLDTTPPALRPGR